MNSRNMIFLSHLYPEFLQYDTMILLRPRIIVGDAGFEPGTEVWRATNEPPHLNEHPHLNEQPHLNEPPHDFGFFSRVKVDSCGHVNDSK